MVKRFTCGAAALLLAIGCASTEKQISGVGPIQTREVPIGVVKKVHVSTNVDLRVTAGTSATRVKVTAPADELDYVLIKGEGDNLTIKTQPGYSLLKRIVVDVETPEINGISVSGSANVKVTGISSDRFDVDVSGSALVQASGITNETRVRVSGSASVDCLGLTSDAVNLEVSGSADVKVTVVKKLSTSVSGSAKVEYRGDPASIQSQSSGSARILQIK